jgi:hypothetical protein
MLPGSITPPVKSALVRITAFTFKKKLFSFTATKPAS